MLFWGSYFLFSIALFIFSYYVKKQDQRKLVFIYGFFLWFLAAFRHMVGTDYLSYKSLYSMPPETLSDIFTFRTEPVFQHIVFTEPLFQIIVFILNYFGFDYQMLFLVMESIVIYFLIKAFYFYLVDDNKVLIALIIYGVFSIGFFLSLNVVRQVVAMSIVLYASKYIIFNNCFRFFIYIMYASLFHYSAILFFVMYWFSKIKISMRSQVILLLGCLLFAILGYNLQILFIIMDKFTETFGLYKHYVLLAKGGILEQEIFIPYATIMLMSFYLYIYKSFSQKCQNNVKTCFLLRMTFVYFFIRIFCLFKLEGIILFEVISRFSYYWSYFFIILIVIWLSSVRERCSSNFIIITICILLLFSCRNFMTIYNANKNLPYEVSMDGRVDDYNYGFNFKLVK